MAQTVEIIYEENDIWIAATCLELGVPLLTRDGHYRGKDLVGISVVGAKE